MSAILQNALLLPLQFSILVNCVSSVLQHSKFVILTEDKKLYFHILSIDELCDVRKGKIKFFQVAAYTFKILWLPHDYTHTFQLFNLTSMTDRKLAVCYSFLYNLFSGKIYFLYL